MNKQKITIWGREFNLTVSYDCLPDEQVLSTQKEAAAQFLAASAAIEQSKKDVEDYILKNNSEVVNGAVDNIFKYVMPKSLYVPRKNGQRCVAIICDYKFDSEHGLAVVFEDEKVKAVGSQDIIL